MVKSRMMRVTSKTEKTPSLKTEKTPSLKTKRNPSLKTKKTLNLRVRRSVRLTRSSIKANEEVTHGV